MAKFRVGKENCPKGHEGKLYLAFVKKISESSADLEYADGDFEAQVLFTNILKLGTFTPSP